MRRFEDEHQRGDRAEDLRQQMPAVLFLSIQRALSALLAIRLQVDSWSR